MSVRRKFLKVWAGRDDSIYIHLYRPLGQPWQVPGTEVKTEGRTALDFTNFQEPSFALNKITFHRGGYVHLTNAAGKRFRDGLRGPAFADMAMPYDLCWLVPCSPADLRVSSGERDNVVEIVLPDAITPFYASLSLVKTATPLAPVLEPLLARPIRYVLKDSDFSLVLTLRIVHEAVSHDVPSWPPFPFFILRTAAQ